MTASVVSAAILEGNLIIGLSDGSVINCGYVQGPPGLSGEPGPMGSTGDSGRDGNTIITVAGTPRNDAGKDGDYAIDNVNWRIFGPKAGGVWGKANDMLPSKDNLIVNGRGFEGGAGGSGDSGGGGGGEGIRLINGGDGITTDAISSTVTEVSADIDTTKGLQFDAGKIAINVGTGLEFDAATGAIKSAVNAAEYAKITYVDTKTAPVPYRIETDKVLRDGKASTLSTTAEIQLVDNEDNFTNVKFTGLNGIGVTSDQQGITFDGAALLGDITVELDDYATKAYSDAADQNLQNQIDDLSVSRGKVARYEVKNVDGTPVSRPGELATNNPFWSNVILVSFGIEDLDGALTKPINTGDIIDFVDVATEKLSRYKVTDATGAPTAVGVEYISGNAGFGPTEEKQVYIYPQNEAGASKEYVDAQDALLFPIAGGTITGTVSFKRGSKSSNQFKISPNSGEDYATNIYGLSNGAIRFRTSKSNNEGDYVGSHIVLSPNDGVPTTAIYNLIEPTKDDMPATRKYVDEQITTAKPAQLSWIYDGEKSSAQAPADGKFYKNGDYLRFSFKTDNGVDLSVDLCPDTGSVTTQYGPVGVIWYYAPASGNWKMKRQFRTESWRWNYNGHFEFQLSSSKGHAWSTLSTGNIYHITIGGWF